MVKANDKILQAKRKHHYVWANYMMRWSPNALDVYYSTKKNNIAVDSVRGLNVERDFYKMNNLTNEHIQVIKGFSRCSDDVLHKEHMSCLDNFLLVQQLSDVYKGSGIQDKKMDALLKAVYCNFIENYHSVHESRVHLILESLANKDLSVLGIDNNMLIFMVFISHQITRTKAFKDNILTACVESNSPINANFENVVKECWWFMGYMFGKNIGRSLYLSRKYYTHSLLINETNKPFITSDQPIVNTHQAVTNKVKKLEDYEYDLYFPISPKVAYMINRSSRFPEGKVQVCVDIVDEMNIKIAKNAHVHIISNSNESIRPYLTYIGTNFKRNKEHFK